MVKIKTTEITLEGNKIADTRASSVSVFDNKKEDTSLANEDGEWLTTEEAANYLRVSADSLRNLTSSGQVPYYKLQRRNRYRKSELRELILRKKGG